MDTTDKSKPEIPESSKSDANTESMVSDRSEASCHDKESEKSARRELYKKLTVLFFITLSALLSVICITLFISTLPLDKYFDLAGTYEFIAADANGILISPADMDNSFSLRLSDNGWCHFSLGETTHHGRWENIGEKLYLSFGDRQIEAAIENDTIILINPLERNIDLTLSKVK